ncbi:MAG: Flp family type IVb pilin, partial [Gemmataceae bacterium]
MKKFAQLVVDFVNNEDGPTAVEYAVMLALIVVVCITAITTLGTNA